MGLPPHGDEHAIALDRLGSVAFDDAAALLYASRRHAAAQAKFESLLLENLVRFLGDFAVGPRQNAIEIFEHDHVRPEALPHGAHFQADVTRADDDHVLGHFFVRQGFGAGADEIAFELDSRQRRRLAAGGDHHVLALELLLALFAFDGDAAVFFEPAAARVARDFVLGEQPGDPLGEHVDNLGLAFLHLREVQLDPLDVDAELAEMQLGLDVMMARFEQRLAGNAAHAQARAAEGIVFVDAGDVHSQLSGPNGPRIPARPRTDNDQIVFCHFTHSLNGPFIKPPSLLGRGRGRV